MSPPPATTVVSTLVPGPAGPGGYRRLVVGPGEPTVLRRELGGAAPGRRLRSLVSFCQVSDLHITDVQSPGRAEFLDRIADPGELHAEAIGRVGTYRAQEALTHQVVEAMTRALGAGPAGPATGAELAFAVSTGDATDNCQANELAAYLALLDGGATVTPDSGDPTRYEGVGGPSHYDLRYFNPHGTPAGEVDDLCRSSRGFPQIPGLLDACRVPFGARGLPMPWYAVYGNHDSLLGGTLAPDDRLERLLTGAEKTVGTEVGTDVLALLAGNETGPSTEAWGLLSGPTIAVTPDPGRRPVATKDWIAAHLASPGRPLGHGLRAPDAHGERAYYAFDAGPVRFLALDTVNRAGGWQGSLDDEQFAWLESELAGGHRLSYDDAGRARRAAVEDRLFVLLSHHPLETLVNPFAPDGSRRRLAGDVAGLLAGFPNVLCWVNGHTHEHSVTASPAAHGRGGGYWQLTTGSHIDWPQQARLLEIVLDEDTGDLGVVSAVLDHSGAPDPRAATDLGDPLALAGWSRELALNAWQGRSSPLEPWGRGGAVDRNVHLVVPAPFRLGSR